MISSNVLINVTMYEGTDKKAYHSFQEIKRKKAYNFCTILTGTGDYGEDLANYEVLELLMRDLNISAFLCKLKMMIFLRKLQFLLLTTV